MDLRQTSYPYPCKKCWVDANQFLITICPNSRCINQPLNLLFLSISAESADLAEASLPTFHAVAILFPRSFHTLILSPYWLHTLFILSAYSPMSPGIHLKCHAIIASILPSGSILRKSPKIKSQKSKS